MGFLSFGIVRAIGELILGASFIRWLGSFVEDPNGKTSSKRLSLVMSVTVSCLGILWIVICRGVYLIDHEADIALELAVLIAGASGTGAVAYILGKPSERKTDPKDGGVP